MKKRRNKKGFCSISYHATLGNSECRIFNSDYYQETFPLSTFHTPGTYHLRFSNSLFGSYGHICSEKRTGLLLETRCPVRTTRYQKDHPPHRFILYLPFTAFTVLIPFTYKRHHVNGDYKTLQYSTSRTPSFKKTTSRKRLSHFLFQKPPLSFPIHICINDYFLRKNVAQNPLTTCNYSRFITIQNPHFVSTETNIILFISYLYIRQIYKYNQVNIPVFCIN